MPSKNLLVMVADDSDEMREMVSRHLRTMRDPAFDVLEATDGAEAIALARTRKPDLVVLDVMMPEVSGWEVCKAIREEASLAHTAVVILTGIGETVNQLTSPLYGADAHIDKPFDFEQFDELVRGALTARARASKAGPGVKKASAKKAPAKKSPAKKAPAKKAPAKKAAAKKVPAKKAPAKKAPAKKGPAKKAPTKKAPAKKAPAKKASRKK